MFANNRTIIVSLLNSHIFCTMLLLLMLIVRQSDALKCLDCVGKDCMGSSCKGDYCVLSHYAPRWGTAEWGEPKVVKGCMSGTMLRKDIRSHCETSDEDGEDVFTCFCNNKDFCNGGAALKKLEIEPIQLLTCVCEGSHCKEPTCQGELCSYVVNHNTKQTEQGCVNASVPLIERRSSGACMIPPITGAMHHTVAKTADDLLVTESCICGSDYCNREKPEPKVPEKMKCDTFVKATVLGTKMTSRKVTCSGEYCFKVNISSTLGHMTHYSTIGCASFVEGSELAEELNPTGCAKFTSENIDVEACIRTNDKRALARARSNQQIADRPKVKSSKNQKGKTKPKIEITYEDDDTEAQEEEEFKDNSKNEEKNEEEDEKKVGNKKMKKKQRSSSEDDSNTALISVFLLLILLIILSGAVWKLQLHKRLFRANYDTVAGACLQRQLDYWPATDCDNSNCDSYLIRIEIGLLESNSDKNSLSEF